MKTCYYCKKSLDIDDRPARPTRNDECPKCAADLKVCLNCRFYDPGAYNKCREPQAERVTIKDKANFCDFFVFRVEGGNGEGDDAKDDADTMQKLKKLFNDD